MTSQRLDNIPTLMSETEPTPESLFANFQTLSAEGDLLLQRGCFHEAVDIYSKALEIRPEDKHCLVSRSRCYIQIGSPELGLLDAVSSLKDNPEFFKGIYLKAEAMYAQGDFEQALLFYHRGNKLRPELSEFRIGIQKAQEAIDNSIGDAKRMKIKVPEKLRKNWALYQEKEKPTTPQSQLDGKSVSDKVSTKSSIKKPEFSATMESKLLGELYDDKVYLAGLLQDRDFKDYPDENIHKLVNDGLRYLNTRLDFWRQQNPLYARHKVKRIGPKHEEPSKPKETKPSSKPVKLY